MRSILCALLAVFLLPTPAFPSGIQVTVKVYRPKPEAAPKNPPLLLEDWAPADQKGRDLWSVTTTIPRTEDVTTRLDLSGMKGAFMWRVLEKKGHQVEAWARIKLFWLVDPKTTDAFPPWSSFGCEFNRDWELNKKYAIWRSDSEGGFFIVFWFSKVKEEYEW